MTLLRPKRCRSCGVIIRLCKCKRRQVMVKKDTIETKVVNQWKVALYRALLTKGSKVTWVESELLELLLEDSHVLEVLKREQKNG